MWHSNPHSTGHTMMMDSKFWIMDELNIQHQKSIIINAGEFIRYI